MKTLLIGLGVMGSNHLRVLNMLLPKNEIIIYDKNQKKLDECLKYNKISQSKNLESLLSISSKVIIATSTNSHINLIKKCIKFARIKTNYKNCKKKGCKDICWSN